MARSKEGISLPQMKYQLDFFEETDFLGSKSVNTKGVAITPLVNFS